MRSINLLVALTAAALLNGANAAHADVNSWTLSGPDAGWSYSVALDPIHPQIAVLSTVRGVYRTTDGAAHWTLVNDGPDGPDLAFDPTNSNRVLHAANGLWLSMDGGQTFALAQGPATYLRHLAFASTGAIYVSSDTGQVYRSTDHANTWTPCASLPGGNVNLRSLSVDPNPNTHDHLFVSGSDWSAPTSWTYRSTDDCASWTAVASGDPAAANKSVYHFAVKPGDPTRVIAAGDNGVSLSTDGGAHWTVKTPINSWWAEFDPHTPGDVIALDSSGAAMLSADDGATWNSLFGVSVQSPGAAMFAFDPVTPGRILMATYQGPYESTDSGRHFSARATGLQATYIQDFSTSDDGTVYATFSPGASGVFRRDPTTRAWAPVNNAGLAQAISNYNFYVSHVATAPTDSSLIYAGAWLYKLARSNDGGATWQPAHPTFYVNSISTFDTVVDPDSALVAYSATDHGVYKTSDGGTTWVPMNTGLPPESRYIMAAPGSDDVYVIAYESATPSVTGLYKSSDGGASWTPTGTLPRSPGYSGSVSIDPSNPGVVYATGDFGLVKSVNAGATWTPVTFNGLPGGLGGGTSLLIDPVHPSTLTLAGYSNFVARTVDGGAHWEPIIVDPPTQRRLLTRAVLDPLRPSVIIGGMLGSSIAEYEVANDLAVTVTGLAASLGSSSNFSATISVNDLGPHGASPSELDIGFPAWLTPTVPATCTRHLQTLHCLLPALQLNESYALQLPIAVSAQGGTGPFTAALTTHEADTDSSNNNFALAVTGSELANLALGVAAGANSLDHGASTTITWSVANQGPSPSTLTTLAVEIPPGLDVTGHTQTRGTCVASSGAFNCDFGTLNSGQSIIVTMDVLAATPGTKNLVGHADGAGSDSGSLHDNTQSLTVRAVGDASVELAESADPVRVGTSFTYTATLRNLSGDASGVHLTVPVTGAKVKGATPTSGNCTTTVAQVDCDVASLASGASASVTIDLDAASVGIAAANATATYAGTDTTATNNTASIGTTLRLEGDLTVGIAESADPATTGVAFNYIVTVKNNGPNDGGVHLSVPVTGATIASASMSGATCTNASGTVTCDLASLAKDASATLTISVSAAAAGSATATATASFSGTDLVSSNDSATANTTVANPPPPPASSGSSGSGGKSGGGGSLDWLLIGWLGAALGLHLRRTARRCAS